MRLFLPTFLSLVCVLSSAACAQNQTQIAHFCKDYDRMKNIAPADVEQGNSYSLGLESINVPITLDLAQAFNLDLPTGVELKPDVSFINIHRNGRVVYNGQDISRRADSLCNGLHFDAPTRSHTTFTRGRQVIEPVKQTEPQQTKEQKEEKAKADE